MVSNHFGAKVATQRRGALPTAPRLPVLHYLSLISRRFGGPAATVMVAGRMPKGGDRRRHPVTSAGDAWVEGGMSPGLGRCPQKGMKALPRLGWSLRFSHVGEEPFLALCWRLPGDEDVRKGPRTSLMCHDSFWLTVAWYCVLNTLLLSSAAVGSGDGVTLAMSQDASFLPPPEPERGGWALMSSGTGRLARGYVWEGRWGRFRCQLE